MSTYAIGDLEESLGDIKREDISSVAAAWGESPEGYGSWTGGFLLHLKDDQWAYVTGWCDTSGWGCQDGREVTYFDAKPDLAVIGKADPDNYIEAVAPEDWDLEPADLNRFIRGEVDGFGDEIASR